jgi:hypothetical protein
VHWRSGIWIGGHTSSECGCVGTANRTNGSERFLYVEGSSPAAGFKYQAFKVDSPKPSPFEGDVISRCPRLILLAVIPKSKDPIRLQLTLYRPISLPTLLKLCNEWITTIPNEIVNLFGRHFFLSKSAQTVSMPLPSGFKTKDITNLDIKPGAYLSGSAGERHEIPWHPIQNLQRLTGVLRVEDEVNLSGIKETLAILFDCAEEGEVADKSFRDRPSLVILECSPSILGLVAQAVSRESMVQF